MNNQENSIDSFVRRHVGPRANDIVDMLATLGLSTLDQLVDRAVPPAIRVQSPVTLEAPVTESEVLRIARRMADRNQVFRSYIGMGYYDCVTPPVIQRNILENPGWYTQYTPYQAEISQGRLEALINFQTMISDLTGLPLSNASLLDEGTAAAEAMTLAHAAIGSDSKTSFFVSDTCHPQTIDVVKTRATHLGITVEVGDHKSVTWNDKFFAALVQYPATDGVINDYREFTEAVHSTGAMMICAADIMSLILLQPPAEWGADVVVGSSQRFGIPLGFGGPHAAFFSTSEEYKRLLPGRLVGVSRDSFGNPAYRLSLQTREQHIRRDKATSNICTAQVLLAIMAGMYAVYHGPKGLHEIATRINRLTVDLAQALTKAGIKIRHQSFFDTLRFEVKDPDQVLKRALEARINLRSYADGSLGVSLDEVSRRDEVAQLFEAITASPSPVPACEGVQSVPSALTRSSDFLTHPVFNSYYSETEMLRYITRLQNKDLSLTTSMIPLGSCTMKLNAAAEMMAITWPEWGGLHPFAPLDQAAGYMELIGELERDLGNLTGMAAVSLQPNSGAQGEYAGLCTIADYHLANGNGHRNICLIPQSAHGTNPASAVMAGFKVVAVKCAENGDVDLSDLKAKAEKHRDALGALMVTYPSTHGVFEEGIVEICKIIHGCGGQVYMDGANMNAMVGICRPGDFGVDVCHLNLHKTFCIPHGGGGPGVGPIAVAEHLAEFLPGHFQLTEGTRKGGPVAASPWGSASVLPISWAYIRLMGVEGLIRATQVAILNANYIAKRLEGHFPVLYKGKNGMVAHECILDCRRFKKAVGITVGDIAKRLMDYGFHAPTISWPVVETVMVEPTESESKAELDRFCDAMISIRREIDEVEAGKADHEDNVLKNAPHTAESLISGEWLHPYSREKAAYPVEWLKERKFWTSCGRIDDTYGDRHLFCACVPVEGMPEH